MRELRILCLVLFSLLSHGGIQAEQQNVSTVDSTVRMRHDYITASLLVVSPSSEVYSMFGHCALRLQCPTHHMDYCFTFESSTDTEGALQFLRGKSAGGFVAAPTTNYLDYYRQEGRSVTQHTLLLTPEEKLRLWQAADQEIARGFCYHYDYMHTQCASMVVSLITSVLPTSVAYPTYPDQLQGSFRDQMLTESAPYPWSRFFWQSIMGPEGDETEPFEQKLTPRLLPIVWQQTTIADQSRPLIKGQGQPLVAPAAEKETCWFTPARACTILFIIVILLTIGQYRFGWHRLPLAIDLTLLTFHTLVSIFITALVFFSTLEATQWNWYLPVFNPLPLVLWIIKPAWLSWISGCLLAVMLLTVVLTPLIPQLDWPQALLMGSLAVRLITRINNNTISQKLKK